MAEQFTTVYSEIADPRGARGTGLMLRDKVDRAEAIRQLREQAQRNFDTARAILETPDEDFRVYQHRGVWSQTNKRELLP